MSADFHGAATGSLFDAVGAGFQKERPAPLAPLQRVDGKFLDEGFRSAAAREPRCPDLHGGSAWDAGTALASGIRQEITEPPSARTVRQAKAQEPRFIAAAHAEPGKRQIQRSHITGLYYWVMFHGSARSSGSRHDGFRNAPQCRSRTARHSAPARRNEC